MACCSSCYVTWAQQFGIYLLPIVLWITTRLGSSKSSSAPPTYGPWYLPAFVRGGLAAYRLGDDEDGFLVRTAKEYGPVVYLPWPLCQYFVLDGDVVQRVYETPSSSLSFVSPPFQRTQDSVAHSDSVSRCLFARRCRGPFLGAPSTSTRTTR